MTITKIEKQKRGSGFNIYIENGFLFSIYSQKSIVDADLYTGKILSSQMVKEISKTDLFNYFLDRIMGLLSRRPRSTKEISDYLYKNLKSKISKKNLSENLYEELTKDIIEYLKEKNYINDLEFTKFWVNARKNSKSKRILFQELVSKGISRSIIELEIGKIKDSIEKGAALKIADKKIKLLTKYDRITKDKKLKEFLYRKGYNWEIIKEITAEILDKEPF
jgi:regulatory protein